MEKGSRVSEEDAKATASVEKGKGIGNSSSKGKGSGGRGTAGRVATEESTKQAKARRKAERAAMEAARREEVEKMMKVSRPTWLSEVLGSTGGMLTSVGTNDGVEPVPVPVLTAIENSYCGL